MKQANTEITIHVSRAQDSALECLCGGGLEPEEFPYLAAAWRAGRLVFTEAEREGLWTDLNDASNAEDAHAEILRDGGQSHCATLAGRAARSFGVLAGKVLMGQVGRA